MEIQEDLSAEEEAQEKKFQEELEDVLEEEG